MKDQKLAKLEQATEIITNIAFAIMFSALALLVVAVASAMLYIVVTQ